MQGFTRAASDGQIAPVIGLYHVDTKTLHRFDELQREGDTITVGRARSCHVQLTDATVSFRHCEITLARDGSASIQDAATINGTFLNGIRVTRHGIRPGMRLHLGNAELIVMGTDPTIPITARTLSAFYFEAVRLYGSPGAAAVHINKSASTISRAERKRRARRGV